MRQRSSQLAFFLILLCSVQFGEEYARQLVMPTPASVAVVEARVRALPSHYPARPQAVATRPTSSASRHIGSRRSLAPAESPAIFAASIAHFTSFLRA